MGIQNNFIDIRMEKNRSILIHENNITTSELQEKIKEIKYHGQRRVKDDGVEYGRIPTIAKIFYQTIFFIGFPTPEELIQIYFKKHKARENATEIQFKGNEQFFSKEGVKGRIYRSYPSLIRDYHFYLLCQESNKFEEVSYSLEADMYRGIDVSITYKGQPFAVALFVETKRSNQFKKKKYGRHSALDIPEICVTINPFNKDYYVGDYALYQQEHMDSMIQKMEEYLNPIN